jgi:hypothetical protein
MGIPLRSVGAPFSTGTPSHFILFFHYSCIRPRPPFFSLLLTTMPHGSRSVTTSLDCVRAPTVAVLCEGDSPSSGCVVQLERKKKKRVSVIVGNRKVLKKSANVVSVSTLIVEQLMDDVLSYVEATFLALQIHADTGSLCFESITPRDAKALAWLMDQGASQADIAAQASKAASSILRSASHDHKLQSSNEQLLLNDHKSPSSPSNDHKALFNDPSNDQSPFNDHRSPTNKPSLSNDHKLASNDQQPSIDHKSIDHKLASNGHQTPSNYPQQFIDHKSASNDQQAPSNDQQPSIDPKLASDHHKLASNNLHLPSNDQQPTINPKLASNHHRLASNNLHPLSNDQQLSIDHKMASNYHKLASNDQRPSTDPKLASNHHKSASNNIHPDLLQRASGY